MSAPYLQDFPRLDRSSWADETISVLFARLGLRQVRDTGEGHKVWEPLAKSTVNTTLFRGCCLLLSAGFSKEDGLYILHEVVKRHANERALDQPIGPMWDRVHIAYTAGGKA